MEANTTTITAVKHEVQIREWAAQVEAQQASGLFVKEFCSANGINPKTYYYHLRKIREECIASVPAIVPVTMPSQSSDIRIEKYGLTITLPSDISPETLTELVHELLN